MKKRLAETGTTLLSGRVYVIVHGEWGSAHSAIATALLFDQHGSEKIWITDGEPGREWVGPLFSELREELEEGLLRVYAKKAQGSSSPERILEEIEYFGVRQRSFALIEGAESFFAPNRDLLALQNWVASHGCTLVLMCAQEENDSLFDRVRRSADRVAGIARIRKKTGLLSWDVLHWFGIEGLVANRSFRLHLTDSELLVEQDDVLQAMPIHGVDDDLVFAVKGALGPAEATPEGWRIVDDLDSLLNASAGTKAATLVLSFNPDLSFDELPRTVFNLRHSRGPHIKIVVREMDRHLRHGQEQLLIKVGANLVVPPTVNFSRFLGLVSAIQGQSFQQALPPDYTEALAHLTPDGGQGYLEPKVFVEAVERHLQQSAPLDIQNALIRLPLPEGLTAAAALSLFTMTRPGDFCTADDENLYLFFFACRENDVDLALERLFEIPVTELFEGETRCLSAETIRQEIEELALHIARAPYLDQPVVEKGAEHIDANEALVAAGERRIRPCAVRRPLTLKQAERGEAEIA